VKGEERKKQHNGGGGKKEGKPILTLPLLLARKRTSMTSSWSPKKRRKKHSYEGKGKKRKPDRSAPRGKVSHHHRSGQKQRQNSPSSRGEKETGKRGEKKKRRAPCIPYTIWKGNETLPWGEAKVRLDFPLPGVRGGGKSSGKGGAAPREVTGERIIIWSPALQISERA